MEQFYAQFRFDPANVLRIGVERESFLIRNGRPVPIAVQVLPELPDRDRFGYELSACQLEDRVGPVMLADLKSALAANDAEIARVERKLGFTRSRAEVGPVDMPLDIYPDPTGRYRIIAANLPRDILLAACRVIGTHVHVGMPDRNIALAVHNHAVSHWRELVALGDGSGGERLRIYSQMAPDFIPAKYPSWEAFREEAETKGFVSDPRRCWHLIRISKHGTIEFRMFGTTPDLDRIVGWATECHALCAEAMEVL